jgi:hypothetical protein
MSSINQPGEVRYRRRDFINEPNVEALEGWDIQPAYESVQGCTTTRITEKPQIAESNNILGVCRWARSTSGDWPKAVSIPKESSTSAVADDKFGDKDSKTTEFTLRRWRRGVDLQGIWQGSSVCHHGSYVSGGSPAWESGV